MSAPEAAKPVDVPAVDHVEPVPAVAGETSTAPVLPAATTDVDPIMPVAGTEPVAPVEEKKDEKKEETKAEDKVVEPIHSGALGYKAPGLKNAFRFSKRYFWFGEEPVPSSNLAGYLRGEKPDVAHPVAAWSTQTGKGLLFFVKHADQKEHPAGVLSLAYAADLAKDGVLGFTFKLSGSKHAFEAQSAAERDGWFVAVETGIAEAKEAREGIESSEGYKEQKDKISKPAVIAAASAPKKSTDVAPKLAEGETPVAEGSTAAPARAGSSSSSSSDEDKKAKKKSKSRSLSRGKRSSLFGGLLGKKDKEHKEGEASKAAEGEAKKEESSTVAPIAESSTTAPVITTDIPKPSEELKTEITDAPAIAVAPTTAPVTATPVEEAKKEETPIKAVEEKPKPVKRGSIFGSFVEKLKSPREEKKEADFPTTSPVIKEAEPAAEASKAAEETPVVAPVVTDAPAEPVVAETAAEPSAAKVEDTKPAATGTPSKEKEHFSFGKLFSSKERAKSPAAAPKEPTEAKADVPPKIEDAPTTTPVVPEIAPVEPVEPAVPAIETKAEPKVEEAKKDETPTTPKKRTSIFGTLSRSLSKATGKKDKDATKTADKKEKLPETAEEAKTDAPVEADKAAEEAAPAVPAASTETPVEKTIGDVPAEAVTVGEPKSAPAVAST